MAKPSDETTKKPTAGSKAKSGTQADKARSGDPRKRAEAAGVVAKKEAKERHKQKAQKIGNPSWFVPVMVGLMVIGLLWVVTYYITEYTYPVESIGRWNLGVGFALMMSGFMMTTRWK